MQNWLVVSNSIPQAAHIVEHSMGIFPEKRRRCIHKETPRMRAPEMVLIVWSEKSDPESETQLGNNSGGINRLSLPLQRLLGLGDSKLLNGPESHTRCVVPMRPELSGKAVVQLIAQCDLKSLNRPIQRLAQSSVPHVKPESVSEIACRDGFIALQPLNRYGTP